MSITKNIFAAMAVVATFGFSATAMTTSAEAAAITDAATYDLTNGNSKPRGVTVFHEGARYNVDFEAADAEVFFTYDGGSTATITGSGYDEFLDEYVAINFTYTDIEQDAALGLVAYGTSGSGTIGNLALGAVVATSRGYSFAANLDASGALKLDGWLTDGGDWHAFGTPTVPGGGSVPAPGGLALILVGLAGLGRKFPSL